jgi:hypothetical protein
MKRLSSGSLFKLFGTTEGLDLGDANVMLLHKGEAPPIILALCKVH